jgi:hypothetical protein
MSLQQKLDAIKANFTCGQAPYFAPPEIHAILAEGWRQGAFDRPERPTSEARHRSKAGTWR